MRILSLDLGTKTGYAYGSKSYALESGTMDWATKRHEGAGMRYFRFQQWLDTLGMRKGDLVLFEEVRSHNSVGAAHVYGGLMAALMAWCELKGVAYQSVPVGVIKKHGTGNGSAKKDAMIKAAAEKFDLTPVDDNHADALILWHYGRFSLFPKSVIR